MLHGDVEVELETEEIEKEQIRDMLIMMQFTQTMQPLLMGTLETELTLRDLR